MPSSLGTTEEGPPAGAKTLSATIDIALMALNFPQATQIYPFFSALLAVKSLTRSYAMPTSVHLHEIMDTVPGLEEPYMASVLSLEDDRISRALSEDRQAQWTRPSTSRFRTADVSGTWPKVVNLAEQISFTQQMEALGRQFSGSGLAADMEDWWQRNTNLRTHGFDRLLIPTGFTPSRQQLFDQGVRGRVLLHEFIKVPWSQRETYLNKLEKEFLPVVKRYEWTLFGAYTVVMSPAEILTVFIFREWLHMAKLFESRDSDPDLKKWFDYREQTIDESEEMIILPGHNNDLLLWK